MTSVVPQRSQTVLGFSPCLAPFPRALRNALLQFHLERLTPRRKLEPLLSLVRRGLDLLIVAQRDPCKSVLACIPAQPTVRICRNAHAPRRLLLLDGPVGVNGSVRRVVVERNRSQPRVEHRVQNDRVESRI